MAALHIWVQGHEYLTEFIVDHPLRALIAIFCVAYSIRYAVSTRLEYLVCLFSTVPSLRDYFTDSIPQADLKFADKHDCKPAPDLPKKWPLALDRILQIWHANADGQLLEFFCKIAKDYEPRNMVSQYFLFGPRSYNVLIPDGIESILATNFNGKHPVQEMSQLLRNLETTHLE